MPERTQKPPERSPWDPKDDNGDKGDGPRSPHIHKPDTKDILDRMKGVRREQAKNYKQRTGQ